MQILVISTWWPFPPNNGSKIRLHYLLRALSTTHHVTLVAFCPEGEDVSSKLDDDLTKVQVTPVRVDPFRYVNALPLLKYASPIPLMCWPSPEMRRTIAKIAREKHFDAVVACQPPAGRYALGLPQIPRVFEIDTALSFQMKERYHHEQRQVARWRAWFSWQKAERYERALARQYQVLTVSGPMELEYLSAFAPCTELIPNGVDCNRNRPGLATVKPNTLIYAGALTYSANYDAMQYFLAEIYPLIKRHVPDVTLTITGSTRGVDRTGLQLDDSVRLPGNVDDVRPLIAANAVCVVPIRQGSGTRLKILEAMALGVPVVSTGKGAEGLDVQHGEHLLLADDPQTFAQHILALLRDPALGQRLSARARYLVEQHYDWSFIGQRFLRLVEDVANRHTA
jgi:glycosyltransferase involved in cell wall biosynthesis